MTDRVKTQSLKTFQMLYVIASLLNSSYFVKQSPIRLYIKKAEIDILVHTVLSSSITSRHQSISKV